MVHAGHVQLNGIRTKASKIIKVGDQLDISRGPETFIIRITALSDKRGPATVAQGLYEETPASIAARQQVEEQRCYIAPSPAKRPDKKARRQIIRFRKSCD